MKVTTDLEKSCGKDQSPNGEGSRKTRKRALKTNREMGDRTGQDKAGSFVLKVRDSAACLHTDACYPAEERKALCR